MSHVPQSMGYVPTLAVCQQQQWHDARSHDAMPAQGVASRDIKLENTLLDGSPRPLLKICDFGYSKVSAAAHVHTPVQSLCGFIGQSQAAMCSQGLALQTTQVALQIGAYCCFHRQK